MSNQKKYLILFTCFFIFNLFSLYAQNSVLDTTVSLDYSNISIEELIKTINKKTGIVIQYSNNIIPSDKIVSINCINKPLKKIFNEIFSDKNITATTYRNQILLSIDIPQEKKGIYTKHTISGYITEKGSKESLLGVTIYAPEYKDGTVTNAYGFYSLTLPERDSLTLIYSFVGFQPAMKKIKFDRDFKLDIELEGVTLKEVAIVSDRVSKVSETTQMSKIDIPIAQIKDIPAFLGEKDVLKIIQLMPGVQKGSEGSSGIYVRGGGADQNLIILDGATVYNASHLFGFFSLFNGDALKSVELTKGGFPARYGGRLSSVIDMNMKDGSKEKIKGEGGIGLLSSRLTLEGPIWKDKASFLVSARRTYLDILARPIIRSFSPGETMGYYFYDFNTKLNYDINYNNKIYLSGYFGRDKASAKYSDTFNTSKFAMGWGNKTGTLRWNHLFNDKMFSNASLVFSDYQFLNKEERSDNTYTYFLSYFSGIRDWTVKYDIDYHPNPKHYIRIGSMYTYHIFTPGGLVEKNTYDGLDYSNIKRVYANEGGIYVEDDFKITARLKMNAGLRLSLFNNDNKNYINPEPRISASYNIKEDLAIKASYAVMNQYIHLVSNTGLGLPTDLWLPATSRINPQNSQQLAAGIAKDFLDKNFAITVEGYYKNMNKVLAFKEGASFLDVGRDNSSDATKETWEDKVTSGKGWSYGGELLLQRKYGKLSGWIGYTLSWTQLQFDELNFGKKYYAKYDRRHDISVVCIYKLKENIEKGKSITLSGVWVYGTGNAITLPMASYTAPTNQIGSIAIPDYFNSYVDDYTEYTAKNGYRMAAYHRMDIGIQFHKKLKRHERTWEISIYNIYNRKNPFFYYIAQKNGKNMLKQISLFPIIPSFSYNFKF